MQAPPRVNEMRLYREPARTDANRFKVTLRDSRSTTRSLFSVKSQFDIGHWVFDLRVPAFGFAEGRALGRLSRRRNDACGGAFDRQ